MEREHSEDYLVSDEDSLIGAGGARVNHIAWWQNMAEHNVDTVRTLLCYHAAFWILAFVSILVIIVLLSQNIQQMRNLSEICVFAKNATKIYKNAEFN